MANEYLVPNGDDGGWDTGTFADIDNGGLAPGSSGTLDDNTVVTISGTGKEGTNLTLDLAASVVEDGDTVTQVDVYVRAQNNGGAGDDNIVVAFLIGGIAQGSNYDTGTLSNGSFTTYTANGSTQGWTGDYTASEMDGAQVVLNSQQAGKPEALAIEVSEVEVYVTYTEAAVEPDVSAYAQIPVNIVRSRHV